jgi:hypothetical protein
LLADAAQYGVAIEDLIDFMDDTSAFPAPDRQKARRAAELMVEAAAELHAAHGWMKRSLDDHPGYGFSLQQAEEWRNRSAVSIGAAIRLLEEVRDLPGGVAAARALQDRLHAADPCGRRGIPGRNTETGHPAST